jgi:hypothetical protein
LLEAKNTHHMLKMAWRSQFTEKSFYWKLLSNLQNPITGPIRVELQPQGRKLWFLIPPRSQFARIKRLGAREAGVPSVHKYTNFVPFLPLIDKNQYNMHIHIIKKWNTLYNLYIMNGTPCTTYLNYVSVRDVQP